MWLKEDSGAGIVKSFDRLPPGRLDLLAASIAAKTLDGHRVYGGLIESKYT
jgi:hypothetical protein